MGPREVLDWFQAEGEAASVMIGGSVGLFDWTDRAGLYGPDDVVLAPELLVHTKGNQGPFQNETGDHAFAFTLFATEPGWRAGWRQAVGSRTPLTALWQQRPPPRGAAAALPPRGAFLTTGADSLWVSAVKREQPMQARWQACPPERSFDCAPKRGGVIVRVFDNEGMDGAAELQLMFPVNSTTRVDMLELNPRELSGGDDAAPMEGGAVRFQVGHHAIETVRLDMGIQS